MVMEIPTTVPALRPGVGGSVVEGCGSVGSCVGMHDNIILYKFISEVSLAGKKTSSIAKKHVEDGQAHYVYVEKFRVGSKGCAPPEM